MSWKRFNGFGGRCPVCGNLNRKDCRSNTSNGLVHCRDPLANPSDWGFRGLDAIGFGMWAHQAEVEAWAEKQREEWRRQWQLEREREKNQLAEERAKSLSESERDRQIRALLPQLTLTQKHRKQLHDRGLTDEEIEQRHYRSVTQWQKLSIPVDDRLAGVKRGGNSLLTPDSGILCAIPNEKGQFVAWKLRRDHPDDGSKYLWAAGEKKRIPRPSSHLRSGELPLSIDIPKNPEDNDTVGLAEGVAFKPHLASIKLNLPVIGASGGNWASSPKLLKQYLECLGPKRIVLYADAGSVLNQAVLKSYQKTIALITEWGYQVEIAWWGQIDKSTGDIDEISSEQIEAIGYISFKEFLRKGTRAVRESLRLAKL